MKETVKTTLTCSNCGAPIDFKNPMEKCSYFDSPYIEEILSQMRTEQEIQRRENEYRAYQMRKLKEQAERIQAEKLKEERAAKNREVNRKAWEAYREEQIRLSKLPKASAFFGLNLVFGSFGFHWLYVKCWFKAFMECAFTFLIALSFASGHDFIGSLMAFYVFICSGLSFSYVANNVLEKTDGVEFNVDLKMNPKRKWQKYQTFYGETILMMFSFIFRMMYIGAIAVVLGA